MYCRVDSSEIIEKGIASIFGRFEIRRKRSFQHVSSYCGFFVFNTNKNDTFFIVLLQRWRVALLYPQKVKVL